MNKDELLNKLERSVSSSWYPVALGAVAFFDYLLFIVPISVVILSSVMAAPQKWVRNITWLTVGSTLGALGFALLIQKFGLGLIEHYVPHLQQGPMWISAQDDIAKYGLWALPLVTCLPFADHPIIAVAALAKLPLPQMTVGIFVGKTVKSLFFSWVGLKAAKMKPRERP